MKKYNKLIPVFLVFTLILSIFITGCQRPERPNDNYNQGQNNLNDNNNNGDNLNNGNMGYDGNMDNNNLNEGLEENGTAADDELSNRAERIASAVGNINGVNDATVIITDNTAIVGVDMGNNTEGNVTNDLKREIEDVVRRADTDIDNVTVTADADLFTRIRNISNDIGRGRPISGFGEEVEEILRRITPNM